MKSPAMAWRLRAVALTCACLLAALASSVARAADAPKGAWTVISDRLLADIEKASTKPKPPRAEASQWRPRRSRPARTPAEDWDAARAPAAPQAEEVVSMWCRFLLTVLLTAPAATDEPPDKFIALSEFQVWADAASPEVFKELNKLYLRKGRSHVFNLYPHYEYYVWEFPRMRTWVDEAAALGAFNVFCLGDDTRTAEGRLFDEEGVNPRLKDFLFRTVAYAHEKGFMVAIEPTGLPAVKDDQHLRPWLLSWLGPDVPASSRADIIKLSLEWFGAYRNNPGIAEEVEAFFAACAQVNPDVLIYVDSISGIWRRPQPFHRWLLQRFPGTIISHYLNTDQIDAFRGMGARNMMVQINPSEMETQAGQFFIYHEETVAFLQDVVRKKVRYVSLAGVNFGYSRYNYDLFLEVIRPHLALAPDLAALRRTLRPDAIAAPATKDDVRKWLAAQGRK